VIVIVSRSGPPEAMFCPVLFCEVCSKPVGHSGNAVWFEHWSEGHYDQAENSPVCFVHKHCAGRFEQTHCCKKRYDRHYRWMDLDRFLESLAHNFAHPPEDDPALPDGAHYRAPKPFKWELGSYGN
jgi:hypothetical protein